MYLFAFRAAFTADDYQRFLITIDYSWTRFERPTLSKQKGDVHDGDRTVQNRKCNINVKLCHTLTVFTAGKNSTQIGQ